MFIGFNIYDVAVRLSVKKSVRCNAEPIENSPPVNGTFCAKFSCTEELFPRRSIKVSEPSGRVYEVNERFIPSGNEVSDNEGK